ncbi:uncharacterized protein si:dkey-126g1.9 [Trichomycterus rosablanca]|uniref:uncharacterized protein si:dkey-126g1.9 n=1 Tax=Trichomycterus rosablanca TaxID=2290929 RepID=UPI002F3526AC
MKPKRLVETTDEGQDESGYRRQAWPKNYVPLEESENQEKRQEAREEKKAKKKEKYKKYKKSVRKALHFSWKCLMLGLQNFTVGYSTPLSAAATLVPEYRRAKQKH